MALAEAGAHVLVHYGRSAQEAESLVAAIQTKGGRANAISADLGTPNGAGCWPNRCAQRRRSIGCARVQRRNQQGGAHRGLHGRGFRPTSSRQTSDIADVVAFVASDGARWITGASIPVDGGAKLCSFMWFGRKSPAMSGEQIDVGLADYFGESNGSPTLT
jgi:NAD(P)-dependent dehydrogenase (short-subunit alcohol dehydrogenase family)